MWGFVGNLYFDFDIPPFLRLKTLQLRDLEIFCCPMMLHEECVLWFNNILLKEPCFRVLLKSILALFHLLYESCKVERVLWTEVLIFNIMLRLAILTFWLLFLVKLNLGGTKL